MMRVKLFEVRDRATFIAVLAVKLTADVQLTTDDLELVGDERIGSRNPEHFLLRRAGYASAAIAPSWTGEPYVLVAKLERAHYDPFSWDSMTMVGAHRHIRDNWDKLSSGDVIDVEFLRGETDQPKASEWVTVWNRYTTMPDPRLPDPNDVRETDGD